ncbi:threonine aldolase family protein [Chelatococcus asaccharovorans]|uniref:L-threonine aldolase n=1 Tax=Chelatococcus asaccharovorans TaxID=28210 RepID=A0A2V3UJP1_9HYPH|nr:GntG family PLP-dependent aldolase [Chelatococcus asaccharovorans]MBS7706303.1 aminotransferase class I/II-fold pyridoxal phosphate-dependent enzyme [Chelatococcus asaccharovorans]PXW65057.1 L-threonine aldolase [Chelatococcus asaccharovorans]
MIDLRSDILGGWSADVLKAMIDAANDPRGFAHGEDLNQRALEEELSGLFGFEDALFVPTGTMANQIAVRIWCQPGQVIIADREAHVTINESSSTAGLNGVAVRGVEGSDGHLSADMVKEAVANTPRSSIDRQVGLIWLENTHNHAGGTVSPAGWIQAVGQYCDAIGKPVHMDGARIWNAAVATGTEPSYLVKGATSISVNLNKALGAPTGAAILGNRAFIEEAARVRKMFGGWWRPVGMFAAGASAAMRSYKERLSVDHNRGRRFAALLAERIAPIGSVNAPQTNIVMMSGPSEDWAKTMLTELKKRHVLASPYGHGRIRFVMHAAISDSDIVAAADAVRDAMKAEE